MSLTPVQLLCKYLNDYLFHKVWNCTESEYRGNIIARCLTPKAISNRLIIPGGTVVLPDSNTYYLYSVPQVTLRGLRVRTHSWEKLSDYLNSNYLDLRITTDNGKWLYRDNIYVTGHPTEKAFLIAVQASMFNAIAGTSYDTTKLYVSVYYDSNRETSVTSKYKIVKTESDRSVALNLIREESTTMTFINGMVATNVNHDQVRLGDYVEVINDPDVFGDFVIDLTDEDQCRFYKSDRSGTFNYIVHIPKSLNPVNMLVTHNQVDFFIKPKTGVNPNIKGRFIHRFNSKEVIGQLTHNDFWISEKLVQAYMTELNTTDVELRVVCRKGRVPQYLIEDGNYVVGLYDANNNDETILDFLEGKRDDVSFWKADHLEHSIYNELMFKSILTNPISPATLGDYINAVGYYNVMNIISSRTVRSEFPYDLTETEPHFVKDFNIRIPVNLHHIKNVYINLWVDGKLQSRDAFSTKRIAKDIINITLAEEHQFLNTAQTVVEIFEDAQARGEFIDCSNNNHEITTGTDEIDIYRVIDLVDGSWSTNYFSKNYKVDFAYRKVELKDVADYADGVLTFKNTSYGKTFLVVTKNAFVKMSDIHYTVDELRGNVIISGPITVDIPNFSGNVITKKVPLIWDVFPIVYVNDRELALDVDFSFNKEMTDSGDFVCKTININNTQYFKVYDLINSATNWYTVENLGDGSLRYIFSVGSFLVTDKGKIDIDTNDYSATMNLVKIIDKDAALYGDIIDSDGTTEMTFDTPKDVYLINKKINSNEIVGLTLAPKSTGTVKAYFTTDKCFNHNTDFLIDNVSTKRDIILYYHPSLSMVVVDGIPVNAGGPGYYGRFSPDVTCRQGGFVYQRSMIPNWLDTVINQFGDKTEDISKLNTVLEYFSKINPHDYPDKVILPYSHHITSVVLNAVIKDVIDGKKELVYDPDDAVMLEQISEYLDVKPQDAGLVGTYNDIYADGAGLAIVNTNFKLTNPSVNGPDRYWFNEERHICIRYVAKQGNKSGRWVIENTDNDSILYHAIDRKGNEDPWNLKWVSSNNGSGNPPILRGGQINLRFIDFDSSYAEITELSINQLKAIRRLAQALLPVDTAKDIKE